MTHVEMRDTEKENTEKRAHPLEAKRLYALALGWIGIEEIPVGRNGRDGLIVGIVKNDTKLDTDSVAERELFLQFNPCWPLSHCVYAYLLMGLFFM